MDICVCIKRYPSLGSAIMLTDDGMAIDEFLHFNFGQAQTFRCGRSEGLSVLAKDLLAHCWALIPESHR